MENQTITANGVTFTLTFGGTLKFVDNRGSERRIDDPLLATQLFETLRDGSGKQTETQRVEGWEPAKNLEARTSIIRVNCPK